MMNPIRLSQGDAGVVIALHCRDEDGAPVDLSARTVEFLLYDDEAQINTGRELCAKPDAALGVAEYAIAADDTAQAGVFRGVVRLSDGAGEARSIGGIAIVVEDPA